MGESACSQNPSENLIRVGKALMAIVPLNFAIKIASWLQLPCLFSGNLSAAYDLRKALLAKQLEHMGIPSLG